MKVLLIMQIIYSDLRVKEFFKNVLCGAVLIFLGLTISGPLFTIDSIIMMVINFFS